MKVGILLNVINEHSGARAAIKLGEVLGNLPGVEVTFFGTEQLLDRGTLERLRRKFNVYLFSSPKIISFSLINYIRSEKPDVISAHSSLRILISAYLSGTKIVRTDYGTQFPSYNGDFGTWKVSLQKKLINVAADVYVYVRDFLKFCFSHHTLAISKGDAAQIANLYFKKVPNVYLGCDNFEIPSLASGTADDTVRILSVSRFVPYKGFHILIEAFNKLNVSYPRTRLILIGGQGRGEYFEYLKSLIGNNNNIEIVFDPDDTMLTKSYQTSQIYASCTKWEGLGLPFLEASRFGLPTLGLSCLGTANEVILDGITGFICNDTDLYFKLEQLVRDKNLRQSLGENGREFARAFEWKGTAASYIKFFQSH